jgi:hypothetical protein
MKLQFLTKHAVSNQEMETLKGGKRICPKMSPKIMSALNNANPKNTPMTTTTVMSRPDILIEWKCNCPKKP